MSVDRPPVKQPPISPFKKGESDTEWRQHFLKAERHSLLNFPFLKAERHQLFNLPFLKGGGARNVRRRDYARDYARDYKRDCNSGTSLVEMMVSMMLSAIIITMMIAVLSPAVRIFVRMQQVQFAEMIVDNVAEELKSEIQNAANKISVTPNSDGFGELVFQTSDNELRKLSTDGHEGTSIEPGMLFLRRYSYNKDGNYTDAEDGKNVALVFPKGYYMGNFLGVKFTLSGTAPVQSVQMEVALYDKPERTEDDLVTKASYTVPLRYYTKK